MKHFKILLISIIILTLVNCKKDSDRDEDTTTNTSENYAFGQAMVYDAFKIVHQAANSSKGIASINLLDTNSLFGCDTLIVDTIANPMTITIQFNDTCSERSGSITASFSSKYDFLGTIINISFNNYSYRNFQIESGTISYSFTGLTGTAVDPVYAYTIDNLKIINSSNITMSFSGNQTLTINSGKNTAIITDDSYIISGTATGSTYQGNEFSATITENLTLLGNCTWISSGIVTVNPENKTARTLDFGASCDNKARATVNSTTREFTMP